MLIALVGAIVILAIAMMMFINRVMPSAYAVPDVPGQQWLKTASGTIRYQVMGEGDTAVLFLHGFNSHLGQWEGVWTRLRSSPYRFVRIDLPGYGQSSWRESDFTLSAQASRVVSLMDHLKLERAVLVGTSMGGSLAAWIASRNPNRVSGLALLAPSGYPGSLTYPGLFGWLIRPGPAHAAARWICSTSIYGTLFPRSRARQALSVTAGYGEPWADSLRGIATPTVILWARGDPTTNSDAAAAVNASIGGSVLLLLDKSTGHGIASTRPDLVAYIVMQLLGGNSPELTLRHLPDGMVHPGEEMRLSEPQDSYRY
ncbi:MAG TPA: alpha/beta hydrolase [Steroidobacteraceae bacterium]|nr:alpha/beta hydrolase [Steroidobacteraceae bacterium]